jgi:hypothetical protein
MPRLQKRKEVLPDKPLANETYYHRQDGGLGDSLVKRQLEEQEENERDRALEAVTVAEVVEDKR